MLFLTCSISGTHKLTRNPVFPESALVYTCHPGFIIHHPLSTLRLNDHRRGRLSPRRRPERVFRKCCLNACVTELMSISVCFVQLYDLMTMAFKYQVLLCPRPKDVLLVTFNHLDAIKGFIQDSPAILQQVEETFQQLTDVSGSPVPHLSPVLVLFPLLKNSQIL